MSVVLKKVLSVFLLVATLLFAVNVLLVIIGNGISIEVAGLTIRSILLEFPVIAGCICGILYLFVVGKGTEAAMVIVSVCAAMLGAEGILRITDHPWSKGHVDYSTWYRPSAYFGHELVPSFEGLGPLNVPVKINRQGFRGVEHEKEKPPGTIRVLGLGDSFTFGWGVSENETFLQQLERQLQTMTGEKVEVINSGVPGWGLRQYDLYLKREDLDYSPDVIVVAYFVDDLSEPISAEPEPRLMASALRQEVRFKAGVLHQSRLFNFLQSAGHWVREKNKRARTPYLHDVDERRKKWSTQVSYLVVKPDDEADVRFKGYLRDYLLEFQRLASQRRASLLIMFIPDIAQLFHHDRQYINGVLSQMTQELRIPFIDMTPTFESSDDPSTYYLWPGDPHTNARGHLKMTQALLNLICGPSHPTKLSCDRPREISFQVQP